MREKITTLVDFRNDYLGWPLAPITRDATFRAYVEGLIDQKKWSRPKSFHRLFDDSSIKVDDPIDDAEVDGRQLVMLWGGLDKNSVGIYARQLVEKNCPPRLIERLARSGLKNKELAAALKPAKPKPAVDEVLVKSLVEAAQRIDKRHAAFVASCFNARTNEPAAVVERLCAEHQPAKAKDMLAAVANVHPFDAYAMTSALVIAGYGKAAALAASAKGDIIVAGDCVVTGDVKYKRIAVSGNLTVTGKLDAPYDVVVGGRLTAKSLHAEGSEGVLCVVGDVACSKITIEEHDFEHLGKVIKAAAKAKPKARAKPKAKAKARLTKKKRRQP
jgi:cytoskeletal protein CcmA (bactofilin family)